MILAIDMELKILDLYCIWHVLDGGTKVYSCVRLNVGSLEMKILWDRDRESKLEEFYFIFDMFLNYSIKDWVQSGGAIICVLSWETRKGMCCW